MFERLRRWWENESATLAIISSSVPVQPAVASTQSAVTGATPTEEANTDPVPAQIVQNTPLLAPVADSSAVSRGTAALVPTPETTSPAPPQTTLTQPIALPAFALEKHAPPHEPAIMPPVLSAVPATPRREDKVVEASLEKSGWRDPGYFTPGAYAGRWGLHRGLPRRPTATQLPSAAPIEVAPALPPAPVMKQPEPTATVFGLLAPFVSPASEGEFRVEPESLTEFLLLAEQEVSVAAAHYWKNAALADEANALIDKLLALREAGSPPLGIAALVGTATSPFEPRTLLLLHNVTRAFARGSEALDWRCTDPARGLYRRNGKPIAARIPRRPLFYELFDPGALGASDPGDWYRFFAVAAITACTAKHALAAPAVTTSSPTCVTLTASIARLLQNGTSSAQSAALAWANALHFWETSLYESNIESATRTARQSLQAFRLGLDTVSVSASGTWTWRIARPATAAEDSAAIDPARSTYGTEELVVA